MALPVSASPVTMVKTASSSGTFEIALAKGSANLGVTSEGFRITAQPAASAATLSISASNKGTFQGLITATER